MKTILRSVGAVAGGAVVNIFLSTGSDAMMRALGYFTQDARPMSDGPFAVATVYRAVYGTAGAYLAARLAPNRPLVHALVLGVLGFVASVAGAAAMWSKLPGLGPPSRSSCSQFRPPGWAAHCDWFSAESTTLINTEIGRVLLMAPAWCGRFRMPA